MRPEVLIIGGGVIGLSLARALHKQGVNRITLLEKGRCGGEASWAAAGMLSPQVEANESGAFFDLCCASRDLYPAFADELLDETGIDIELDRTGTLFFAFSDEDYAAMHDRFKWQSNAGLAIKNLDANEMHYLEPSVSRKAGGALSFPRDWQVENRNLLSALKRYAELNGIDIRENTVVEELIVEGNRVRGALTSAGLINADATVLATGAWTSLIRMGEVKIPFKIEPVRGQIIEFGRAEPLFSHVIHSSSGYLVPRRDGRILAGSTSENVGFCKEVTEPAVEMLKNMACELIPNLVDVSLTDKWAGLRPFVSDGMPIIGSLTGLDNLFCGTAHYRNGILLAPLTAQLLGDKVVNNVASEHFDTFGIDRFRLRSAGTGH